MIIKPKVIAIVGPTAVGKTKLSIEVAKNFNGEIISGDSMQVYRGLNIGTAKITSEEAEGIPHYMIDIKNPSESFSVADFKKLVTKYIKEIHSRDKIPIIVGGSGLYIQAVMYDYHFSEIKRDEAYTKHLENQIVKHGIIPLYDKLKKVDPEQAKKIHPNNHRRVIRALEVYKQTGLTRKEMDYKKQKDSPYYWNLIGLEMQRNLLYDRINSRVDRMLEKGLEEEVFALYQQGLEDTEAMRAIGYKEFIPYFKGVYNRERAVELLKRNSRRFAKRQYTWFRNKMDVHWYTVTPGNSRRLFQTILSDLAGLFEEM